MLDVLVILLRLAQYGGAVVLLGTPLFLLYGLRGSDAVALGWTRSLLVSAAAVVAIGSAAAFAAQTAVMAGSLTEGLKPATLGFMLTGTSLGPAFLVRTLAALLALLALIQDKPSRGLWGFFAVAGLIVGASFAWTGHGAATEGAGRYVHLTAAILHSWAAAVWLGALAALLILTFGRRSKTVDSDRILHRALHGFAGVGTASVAVLVLSGLVNSWFMVGPDRIAGLLSTPYGLLLTGKLVLFALMLVLAAANRFYLTPDLGSALDDPEDLGPAISRLKRSLVMETLLALGLLALVSIMGTLAPVSAMEMAM